MARILYEQEWYEQLSSEALYEEEYQRILLDHADSFFPAYYCIPFKQTVFSETGSAQADLALVHKKYREWWVVEAELSHHSLSNHVRPQVETLCRASYGDEVASYLCWREQRLDHDKMHSVVRGQQPAILVIVNAPVPSWNRDLEPYGARIAILEVFRSRYNKHIYRLNGDQPGEDEGLSCRCIVEIQRFLRVLSPGILPIQHGERMFIEFRGGTTEWTRTDLQDRVYLSSSRPVTLSGKMQYELVRREDSTFYLLEAKRSGHGA